MTGLPASLVVAEADVSMVGGDANGSLRSTRGVTSCSEMVGDGRARLADDQPMPASENLCRDVELSAGDATTGAVDFRLGSGPVLVALTGRTVDADEPAPEAAFLC